MSRLETMPSKIAHVQSRWLILAPSADDVQQPIMLDSPDWYAWLAHNRSFAFTGANGSLTAQKERRQRGTAYWYAYRKQQGRLRRAYLGKDADLTMLHLEATVRLLAGASDERDMPAPKPSHLLPSATNGDPLLATKLASPIVPANVVPRTRLATRLAQSIQYRLTLIVAPAGYGKTTLLGAWCRLHTLPVAWLTLDQADNDPARFWRYLLAACATLAPAGSPPAGIAAGEEPGPILAALISLLNQFTGVEDDVVLLLDDYQAITNSTIHEAVIFLLDHLPPRLHLVITSRADPPLPLPRLRARGALSMIGTDDLRFDHDEAVAFLEQTMGLRLAAPDIRTLETRTEGWIAGLQLAALSMRDHPDLSGFITDLTGDHRYISDYLLTEVLEQQPVAVQDFLLLTSILPRLCASLCEAVTGQSDAQQMLGFLERTHLFVAPLDHTRNWFRYHQLFAEALRTRLRRSSPGLATALHAHASLWYERNHLPSEAIEHAIDAQDWRRTLRLIEGQCTIMAARGEQATLQRWLETVPQDVLEAEPGLCVWYGWTLLFNRNIAACERTLHIADQAWQSSGDMRLHGEISNLKSAIAYFRGEIVASIEYAHDALASLPPGEHFQRALGALYLYHGSMQLGKVQDAAQALAQARVLIGNVSDPALRASSIPRDVELAQAALDLQQGRLREAALVYRAILDVSDGRMRSTLAAHLGISKVLRAWNELPQAEQHARQGVDLCRQIGEQLTLPDAYVILAHALAAQDRCEEAVATLRTALDAAEQVGRHATVRYVVAQRARIWLLEGRLVEALAWAQGTESLMETALPYDRLSECLTLIRVRIAQGRPGEVLPVLHLLLDAAETDGRTSDVLIILVLLTLAHHGAGMGDRALTFLERALVLAQPQGHVRLFVDGGAPMMALLERAVEHSTVPEYITILMHAFGPLASSGIPQIEPLSTREREVLLLIAAGASNLEIAERLGLTLSTTKKHVSNIYGKLSVSSRTRAVALAQQLALL